MPERPWLAHYDADVPPSLAYADGTLVDHLRRHAIERPQATALIFKDRRLTWKELDEQSDACAAGLASLGVRRGERVAVILPSCPQWVIAQFALWKLGAVVLALNPIYTEHELTGLLREGGARIAIAMTRVYPRVKAVQSQTALERIVATNIKEYFPARLALLFTLFKERKDGHRITLAAGDVWWKQLLRTHAGKSAASTDSERRRRCDRPCQRRHDRHTQRRRGPAQGIHPCRRADSRVDPIVVPIRAGCRALAAAALPRLCQRRRARSRSGEWQPDGARPESEGCRRRAADDSAHPSRVHDERTDAVPGDAQFPAGPAAQGGLLVDQGLVFRRRCVDGGDQGSKFESMTGGRIIEGYSLTEGMMACLVNPLKGRAKLGSIGVPLPDVDAKHRRCGDGCARDAVVAKLASW